MFKAVALIYAIAVGGGLAEDPTTTRTNPSLRFDTIEACEAYVASAEWGHVDVPAITESIVALDDNPFEDEDEFAIVPVCAPADQAAATVRPAGSP